MSVPSEVEILYAEDNPGDVYLTLLALKKHHLANNVYVVKDGQEALDFLFATGAYASRTARQCPRVILLDLRLPKVDGVEVLRRIKANERTKSIPVVVLTSSTDEPEIEACYRLGVNSYIVKPVNFDKFSTTVAELGFYWVLVNEPPPGRK